MAISLEPLSQDTYKLILPWRNAPAVRGQMYTQHEITPAEHRSWFERTQTDPTKRWYLCRDESAQAVGVVYFTDIDTELGTAFWGFFTAPETPRGMGKRILYATLEMAFDDMALAKLSGEALSSNVASIQLHKQCGFIEEGRFRAQCLVGEKRIDVVRLGMLAEEWPQNRDRLRDRIAQLDALTESAPPPQRIVILSDEESWINDYIPDLLEEWEAQGHCVRWANDVGQAGGGDLCFCLGLGQIVPRAVRDRFNHVLVVHESDLPKGRGWSPLTWQILDGADHIPVTVIEAADDVDSGPVYAQRWIAFEGHELIDELRAAQAAATHALCRAFVDDYPESAAQGREQAREPTYYPRRRPADSELNPEHSLTEQFNRLRVADNRRYPVFFDCRGHRYILRIERELGEASE
jgi:UDP-4-amino-4,6-dideoxy-N-acetyl-beta-L-altrosamine N-acetyltransferase